MRPPAKLTMAALQIKTIFSSSCVVLSLSLPSQLLSFSPLHARCTLVQIRNSRSFLFSPTNLKNYAIEYCFCVGNKLNKYGRTSTQTSSPMAGGSCEKYANETSFAGTAKVRCLYRVNRVMALSFLNNATTMVLGSRIRALAVGRCTVARLSSVTIVLPRVYTVHSVQLFPIKCPRISIACTIGFVVSVRMESSRPVKTFRTGWLPVIRCIFFFCWGTVLKSESNGEDIARRTLKYSFSGYRTRSSATTCELSSRRSVLQKMWNLFSNN